MGNIKKEILWALFRAYIIRKEKERLSTSSYYPMGYRCGGINTSSDYGSYKGVVYFYEWSDLNRSPISFYSLNSFDDFLKKSNIFMAPFQKDMIRNLDRAYVTCKKGKTELLIRGTKPGLEEAFGRDDSPGISINDLPNRPDPMDVHQLKLPYPVSCTFPPSIGAQRVPPMYHYNGNPEEWYG
jgi:hypothetical protein